MTFEVGKLYTLQELADIAKEQLTKIGELEQKLALREAFIAGLQFNKTLYPEFEVKDEKGDIRMRTDKFGNVYIGTPEEYGND